MIPRPATMMYPNQQVNANQQSASGRFQLLDKALESITWDEASENCKGSGKRLAVLDTKVCLFFPHTARLFSTDLVFAWYYFPPYSTTSHDTARRCPQQELFLPQHIRNIASVFSTRHWTYTDRCKTQEMNLRIAVTCVACAPLIGRCAYLRQSRHLI